jgi:sulfite exporter TauE/SafE
MGVLDLIPLFLLGLLGTGHCIGMCGPLVVAFPGRTGRYTPHFFYHLGRIVTYSGIGAVMGGIGSGLAMVSSVTGSDHLQLVARVQMVFVSSVFSSNPSGCDWRHRKRYRATGGLSAWPS